MGSFNTSCFASRQTIAEGDLCMVAIIAQQASFSPVEGTFNGEPIEELSYATTNCYPTRYWRPVTNFLLGKYDDYGRFELVDTPVNRRRLAEALLEALRQTPSVPRETGNPDEPYDLRAFMLKAAPKLLSIQHVQKELPELLAEPSVFAQLTACWAHLFKAISNHRLFWQDYSGRMRPAAATVMHLSAFDELVGVFARSTRAGVANDKPSLVQRTIAKALAHYEAHAAKYSGGGPDAKRIFVAYQVESDFTRIGGGGEGAFLGNATMVTDAVSAHLAGQLEFAAMVDALAPALDVSYMAAGLRLLNLHYEPMVYAGQDYQNQVGVAYADFVARLSPKVLQGRRDHYYGPALGYRMAVSDVAVFEKLSKRAVEREAYLNVGAQRPSLVLPNLTTVEFETPLELDDLKDLLAEFEGEQKTGCLQLASLEAVSHPPR